MLSLGMDIGTSTVKLVLLKNQEIEKQWMAVHHGNPFVCLKKGLSTLELAMDTPFSLCVTGSNTEALLEQDSAIPSLGDIPAIVEGVRWIIPQVGSVIEIGSQGARFITDLQSRAPQFAVNEHCAGGTGSFFEDQMSRIGCKLEDYSSLVEQAQSVPRLSGRCAVFAKTDIIHRQQEGVSTPDILLGLCYAMIRNYKATIVRRLPVCKPVVFCGGVTCNTGVIRAIREVFGLTEEELIVPEFARYEAALGAALKASGSFTLRQLNDSLDRTRTTHHMVGTLPKLELRSGTSLAEPNATKIIPESGCALGIDIGSTSTDLVLVGADGELVDFQYLRTAGDPEGAVRKGLARIRQRFGDIRFTAVGVTGSGRERVGKRIGADVVRDEITAQAKGAAHWVPEVDTVFEIGGQDSKYISIQNGEVVDFQMNKICAAGTGSFVEEQAARMGIPLAEFGPLALSSEHPASLGERCTVFIETAIASASAEGISRADIAAGLCHSIVQNYLHKVVGSKPVGQHIVLQGGVDYNPGIVAAFQSAYGDRVQVSPVFSISGAYGAALLAQEAVGDAPSQFVGFDSPAQAAEDSRSAEIQKNIDFYKQADKLLLEGYTGKRDPRKKTVGVPFALMIHKFFPMANAFFTSLGFNVVLTDPTSEETIRLAQQTAQGETCYPVKLIYGHMQQLIDQKVDYIFLPTIHTMKHEKSRVKHNYGCVYMQTAAASIAKALDIESKGITLLSPVFDLDFGQEAMASAMLGLSKILGIPKPFCAKALLSGAMAVRRHTAAVEKQGKALLATLRPDDKVLVLITRNYGVSDPILNMGIPELLLERGYKVITLSHLPGHALDISDESRWYLSSVQQHFLQLVICHIVAVPCLVIFLDGIAQRIIGKSIRVGVAGQPCQHQRSIRIRGEPVPHTQRSVVDPAALHGSQGREVSTVHIPAQHVLGAQGLQAGTIQKKNIGIPAINLLHAGLCKASGFQCLVRYAQTLHPVGAKGALTGYLRHTVCILPQNQRTGAVCLRNFRNTGFHIGYDLITGSNKGVGLARFVEDLLQQLQPLFVTFHGISFRRCAHGSETDGGDSAGLQDFGMGGVASIVQDNIRVQLHDLLDVQVALSIDRIAGLQKLRGDILQYRVRNDRLERAAVTHDVGSTALKISHVSGQDWNLVDDDTGDLIRHFYFVAAVVYDGMGTGLIHGCGRGSCFAGYSGRSHRRSRAAGRRTAGGQNTGCTYSSHGSDKRTTRNFFHGKLL